MNDKLSGYGGEEHIPAFAQTQLGWYKKTLWALALQDKELADLAWSITEKEIKFTKKLLDPMEAVHRARAILILKELKLEDNTPSEPINT